MMRREITEIVIYIINEIANHKGSPHLTSIMCVNRLLLF